MNIKISELLDKRKRYPLSNIKNSEEKYINEQLLEENKEIGLILPLAFFHSMREAGLRKKIFREWKVAGLFALAEIWRPFTNVKFVLLILQKNQPEYVYISEYKSKDTFTGKFNYKNYGVLEEQKITNNYQQYLTQLEEVCETGKINHSESGTFRIWKIKYSELDLNNLHIGFYDPEPRDALSILKQEKTKPLKELADILRPRKVQEKGLVVKTKNFTYPLIRNELSEEDQTTVKLQKGDILFSDAFSDNKKFYLITEDPKIPLFASTFLVVIRPKSNEITPEYLFLYMQSDTAMKYIQLFQKGAIFPQISSKDLRELPVILPDKVTQKKSESVFRTLFLKDKIDIIQTINQQLFDPTISSKPIQKEFILEELEELRIFKKEVIEKVMQEDLKELNTCIEKKLYKSFLILSGSILEAFLLDWISELEKKDYFSPGSEDFTLGKLIWKLKKAHAQIFDEDLFNRADRIREKRNYVHPKEYFNTYERLNDSVCYEVVNDLKAIFNRRI